MQDQSTIYLGPGDLSLHTLHSCADSAMNLPLGYYQGVSVFIDLDALTTTPPDILSEAGINGNNLYAKFCEQEGHTAMPASEKIEHIFSELYDLPERMCWQASTVRSALPSDFHSHCLLVHARNLV